MLILFFPRANMGFAPSFNHWHDFYTSTASRKMLGTAQTTNCCIYWPGKGVRYGVSRTVCHPVTTWLPRHIVLYHQRFPQLYASLRSLQWLYLESIPVTRGVKRECVLATTLFAIYFSAFLVRTFPSTSGVLLHSLSLWSCSIYLASGPTPRLVGCLYVNCSTPTMRPLLPTVLQMHKYCVILSHQRALTLEWR